ncbi:DNA polymerase III subunit epsilon [Pelagibacteraceae bacterium]|nr:DNA polymerase III subunit epsilon [Pelagibacteraceae bacterium]
MSEIFLDIETTGLSFKEDHKIVEIACIETNELIPTKRTFHKIINPERNVPEEAFKIHGFSSNFLKDKPKFLDIADELLDFIGENDLIIHNASFDIPFINYELKTIKKNVISKNKIIDTLELARGKYPGSSNSLDALCKRFNVDFSRRTKHNAVLDCELLREVYIYLLDEKEPKLSFNPQVEKHSDQNKTINYSKKLIQPSEEELKKHNLFLKTELKKNFF